VEHRKAKSISEHEYILLTVNCHLSDGSITPRYIRVDRHPSKRIPIHFHLGIGVDAKDTISIATIPFSNDDTTSYSLYKMSFPDYKTGPNVLELTTMLMIIASIAPEYRLYTSACYWHSRMVFEGLAYIFQGEVSPSDKPQYRGKYAGLVPVVGKTGSPLLGNPRSLQAWERFQLALERGESEPNRRNLRRLSQLHKLFLYLYYPQLRALCLAVQQAENALERVQ